MSILPYHIIHHREDVIVDEDIESDFMSSLQYLTSQQKQILRKQLTRQSLVDKKEKEEETHDTINR